MNRKILAPIVTVILLVGVGIAVYFSMSEQFALHSQTEITGLVGSEKIPFFSDPEVIEALGKHGLLVKVEKAGSRQIAMRSDLKNYDFAFPAGVPAAEKIKREQNVHKSHPIFFTPMTIASWKMIADILKENGIVEQRDTIHYIVNLEKLLQMIVAETRWSDLNKSENYSVNKGILITSTDIRKSNSAAMYLSLASFILNGNQVITSEQEIQKHFSDISSLFLRQGYMESSSAGPYNDYLVMGPGKSPMVMVYESQFLHDAALPDSVIRDEMLLLYPEPTVFTKHILLPFSEAGEKLAEALVNDPVLQELAIKHGFRNKNIAKFRAFVK
ncbi:MAG: hypothetical protein D6B25_07635, partial [Desulfobulbaceae bacterium]